MKDAEQDSCSRCSPEPWGWTSMVVGHGGHSSGQTLTATAAGGNRTLEENNSPTATQTFFKEANPSGIAVTSSIKSMLGPKALKILANGGKLTAISVSHSFFSVNSDTKAMHPITQQQYDKLSPSNSSNMFSRNLNLSETGSSARQTVDLNRPRTKWAASATLRADNA